VLEANGKVDGTGEISHPTPPNRLKQFGCRCKYITTSAQRVDVPNLIKIDSAVAALRMREKTPFLVGFYSAPLCKRCTSYGNSVCLPVRHTLVLCENDGTYHGAVCTVG